MRSRPATPRAQRGQALTEMAILAIVLVPLFLLVPTLAKFIHVKITSQQAARTAAWESTVAPDYALQAHLQPARQRTRAMEWHFNNADAPIRTAPQVDEQSRLGNPLLNSFTNMPLVERSDIQVQPYTFEQPPGLLGNIAGNMPDVASDLMFPSDNDLVTARVEVAVQDLRFANGGAVDFLPELSALNLRFSSEHTLVADAWNARGGGVRGHGASEINHARSTYQRVRRLTAGNYLSFLDDIISGLGVLSVIPVLGAPFEMRLNVAEDTMDIVPEDKLEAYNPNG